MGDTEGRYHGLDDEVRSWMKFLASERKSPRTVRLYADAVRYYADWCVHSGHDVALTRATLVDYLGHSAETVKPGTALTRFKHLRAFCSFLVAEGDVATSPMAGLKPPTVPEDPVPVLTDAELTALIKAAAAHPDPFTARRDEALLRMLLDTGARISELTNIQLEDVGDGAAWVTGKGSRRRLIIFGARTDRALDRYMRARKVHRHAILPALWLTQRGAMSKDAADERLRVIAWSAGIEDVHAHRFRHTWAHDYLAAGGGEQSLKRLAGWRSDAMLARYGASQADARARAEAARLRRGDRV